MDASKTDKLFIVLSAVLVLVYIVGFSSIQWFTTDIKVAQLHAEISIDLGLFKQCTEKTGPDPVKMKAGKLVLVTSEDCGSDGAEDWQMQAAGLAIAALVLSILLAVLSCLNVFMPKVRASRKLKAAMVVVQILTVICISGALVVFAMNNDFQLPPPLLLKFDMDYGWGYFTTIGADCLAGVFMVITIVDLIRTLKMGDGMIV